MRAMLCGCGQRLEALNDSGLVHETLKHYRWIHGMAIVDGEDIRRIVQKGAYGLEENAAVRGEDSYEAYWSRDLPGRPDAQNHNYEGYGADATRPTPHDGR